MNQIKVEEISMKKQLPDFKQEKLQTQFINILIAKGLLKKYNKQKKRPQVPDFKKF